MPTAPATATLRAIAVVEALKGLIVLGAGFGLLRLVHRNVREVAVSLVSRIHLDPESRRAGLFLDAADHLTSGWLWLLVALALAYSTLRLAEAYGLWRQRRWAAWIGVIGGGIYVPVELYELSEHPSVAKFGVLLLNVAVVVFLVCRMRRMVVAP